MSKGMLGAAGGLSAEDREKLIPENLREGVVLFAGTAREIVGTFWPISKKFEWKRCVFLPATTKSKLPELTEAPAAHGIRTSTEAPVAREAW